MNLEAFYIKGEKSTLRQKCKALLKTLKIDNSWNLDSGSAYYFYADGFIHMVDIRSVDAQRIEASRMCLSTEDFFNVLNVEAQAQGFDTWWINLNVGDKVTICERTIERNPFLKPWKNKELEILNIRYCTLDPEGKTANSDAFNGDYSYYSTTIPNASFVSWCFNPSGVVPLKRLDLEDVPFIKEFEL